MLTSISVVISLLTFISLSLPVGYLIINSFMSRRDLKLPFATLIPLYLAVGTCAQMLISFLVGTSIISSLVPNLVAVSSFIMILFQHFKSNKVLSVSHRSSPYVNIFSLILIIIVFSYFGEVGVETQWPPIGDALLHSSFTSLIIHKGHIATDLEPLTRPELSDTFPYPQGFHALAADVSLRLGLNPGETVFLLAIYIVSLVSTLLFSLTFVLSRSFLISLVPVFSILFLHSAGNYEKWIAAYLWNGPYVQLFAFIAIISLIITLQIWYSRKQSLLNVSPIIVIIFLALFVSYPSFLYHAIVTLAVYFTIHVFRGRFKQMAISDLSQERLGGLLSKYRRLKQLVNNSEKSYLVPEGNTSSALPEREISYSSRGINSCFFPSTTYLPTIVSLVIIAIFVTMLVATDLLQFYYRLVLYNVDAFDKSRTRDYLNVGIIFTEYFSNPIFATFAFVSIGASIIFMFIKLKAIPLFITLYALLASALAGIGFIYPHRTLPFVITLFVPVVAYMVHEIASGASVFRLNKTGNRNRKRGSIIYYAVVSTFVVSSLIIQAPSAYDQLTITHGWFLGSYTGLDDMYDTATWIENNVNSHDLILNDRTYSSLYIHGFAVRNLTYSYLNGFGFFTPAEQEKMFRELSEVWSDPHNSTKVRSLLKEYNVRYIVAMPEGGYPDYSNWGGLGESIGVKPFSNIEYGRVFNSYPFLQLEHKTGLAFVYSVKG